METYVYVIETNSLSVLIMKLCIYNKIVYFLMYLHKAG